MTLGRPQMQEAREQRNAAYWLIAWVLIIATVLVTWVWSALAQEPVSATATYSAREKRGACKQSFDPDELNAAYNDLPCGVRAKVIYRSKSVSVTIVDRIKDKDRIVLSKRAAEQLGITKRGAVPVTVEIEK